MSEGEEETAKVVAAGSEREGEAEEVEELEDELEEELIEEENKQPCYDSENRIGQIKGIRQKVQLKDYHGGGEFFVAASQNSFGSVGSERGSLGGVGSAAWNKTQETRVSTLTPKSFLSSDDNQEGPRKGKGNEIFHLPELFIDDAEKRL